MKLAGPRDKLWRQLVTPTIVADLALTEHIPGKMFPYQYAALYNLVTEYDGGHILEIGGYRGRATLVMSLAAPSAHIITLEPRYSEMICRNTAGCTNVTIIKTYSVAHLQTDRTTWDMVFVDADHNRVEQDLPWFSRLRVGGLILFHDYTPDDAMRSQSPHVYAVVNDMAKCLGRAPDVLIVDVEKVGMAGFYRRRGETLR